MNEQTFLERELSYSVDDEQIVINHKQLLDFDKNLIILGEAGMGKSKLMEELSLKGASYVTARRFINSSDPERFISERAYLLIDALDEVASHSDGDAVDKVLSKLEDAGYPKFIISCRVEDWQAATSTSVIREHYGSVPFELHLRPLSEEQIKGTLIKGVGLEQTEEILDKFNSQNIEDWFGNPQTLNMIERVVRDGKLPETTSDLYEQYVDLCWADANKIRRELKRTEFSKEEVLDTLGAAFASLILSNKQTLINSSFELNDEDIPIAELNNLPGYNNWEGVQGTRLVISNSNDADRYKYSHRRIGEWLGARWLAKYADSALKRKRLLARLTYYGIVPASLRGLFGWLGMDTKFTEAVIDNDPMAIIEYGDANTLDDEDGKRLLEALEIICNRDPWFLGWGTFRAKSLVNKKLLLTTMQIITDNKRSFRLRTILVAQLAGEQLDDDIVWQLKNITLDKEDSYSIRYDASLALIGNLPTSEWSRLLEEIRLQGTHDATRLASTVMIKVGLKLFSSREIVETILSECGFILCAIPSEGEDRLLGKAIGYRKSIPNDRLEDILDLMAGYSKALLPEYRGIESSEVINLGKALIVRRLQIGPAIKPNKLLEWLKGLAGKGSHLFDDEKILGEYLKRNHKLRQAIQKQFLHHEIEPIKFRMRIFEIARLQSQLALNEEDVVIMLNHLPEKDPRWRGLLSYIRHSEEEGVNAREAAKKFTESEIDGQEFLDNLVNPPKADWVIRDEQRAKKYKIEKKARWSEVRKNLEDNSMELQAGLYNTIITAARAYMGLFSDTNNELEPFERLEDFLGEKLTRLALDGFNNYFQNLPSYPSTITISQDYANNKYWHNRDILLASISERVRTGQSLDILLGEQIIAAQLHITNHAIQGEKWEYLSIAVWKELKKRPDQFKKYMQLTIEPCLQKSNEHIYGLYQLLSEKPDHRETVLPLACDWLDRFPRMHWRPETELIDFLLSNDEHQKLIQIGIRRLRSKALSDERKRNWQSVLLILDFSKFSKKINGISTKDKDFLWTIRSRLGGHRHEAIGSSVSLELAAWTVAEFRASYPIYDRPNRVTMGDTNPWDATEYLNRLIDRIGSDTSHEAQNALQALEQKKDGYHERVLAIIAEQKRKIAEQSHLSVPLVEIDAILNDHAPQSLPDIQTYMLELLDAVEDQVKSNDTDVWRGFYDEEGHPFQEERCRDHLVNLLRQHEQKIDFAIEDHIGDDREIDFSCKLPNIRLPVEIKGQWHDQLWSASDNQLDKQQAVDHLAQGYGILLVLWFGDSGKKLKGPPRGSKIKKPKTPKELEDAVAELSQSVKQGKIVIKVIDLSRSDH